MTFASADETAVNSTSNPIHTTQMGNYRPSLILTNDLGVNTNVFTIGRFITAHVTSGDGDSSYTGTITYFLMNGTADNRSLFYQKDEKPYNIDSIHSSATFAAPSEPGIYYVVIEQVNTRTSESNTPIFYTETTVRQITVVAENPSLMIEKTSSYPSYKKAGDIITYTYKVTNNGNVPISGPIQISDNRTQGGAPFTIDINSLVVGQTITGSYQYVITPNDLNSISITNTAYAIGTYAGNQIISNTDTVTILRLEKRSISIIKNAYPIVYYKVGDVITYSYTVINSGNTAIQAPIQISDNRINNGALFTIHNNTLPGGSSITRKYNYTITQADINAGSVTNTAHAEGDHGNQHIISENNDSATVYLSINPKLTIEKTASTSTFNQSGQVITYRYNVTNTGNVPINGPITVSDNRINGPITISPNNLSIGATVSGSATYTITQSDINNGRVTNRATASGMYSGVKITSLGSYASIYSPSYPGFLIEKTSNTSTYDNAGDVITYTYRVTNTGNVLLQGPIKVADNRINNNNPFIISNNSLTPGSSVTGTASYTITQTNVNIGSVTNSAYALASFNGTRMQSNIDEVTAIATQKANLTLDKTVLQSTYDTVGDIIDYSYTITNTGNVPLDPPIVIRDDHIEYNRPIIISNSTLGVGQSVTKTANYNISENDIQSGSVTNIAYATAGFKGERIDSKTDSATSVFMAAPNLSIQKHATPTIFTREGEIVTYTYTVTNTGNVPLTNSTQVVDDKINGGNPFLILDGILGVGESITGTATYTILASDLTTGYVTNTATANSKYNGTSVISYPTSATVNYAQASYALSIQDASGIPQSNFGSGDTVNALFTKTNDPVLSQVTFVWTDPNGNIVKTDHGITFIGNNSTATYQPTVSGVWDVTVYKGTVTTGDPLAMGSFTISVPEFKLIVLPLLFVGILYTYMRKRKQ